jgi:hypothetical protein
MSLYFAGFRIDHPDHPRSRCDQQLNFLCEVAGGLGWRHDFNRKFRRVEEVSVGRRCRDAIGLEEGDIRLNPGGGFFGKLVPGFDEHSPSISGRNASATREATKVCPDFGGGKT